jgi:hypothetical protein
MTRTRNFITDLKMLLPKRNAVRKGLPGERFDTDFHLDKGGAEVHDELLVPTMCTFARMRGGCVRIGCRFCHSEEQLARVYKTRPCFTFIKSGRCPRGDTCGYHHPQSLIPAMCYHMFDYGWCPSGDWCTFCHDDTERSNTTTWARLSDPKAFSLFNGHSHGRDEHGAARSSAHPQYELFGGADLLRSIRCACA